MMVLTPLVNNDPLLVTHGIAAFHSGVKVASLIATDVSVLVVATPLATNLLLDHCLDFVAATPQFSSSEARIGKKAPKAV